jgi:glycosyltransferase involved in cell wall biosynthesis
MIEFSLILPVHNESEIISKSIQHIIEVLNQMKLSYEIICVENGSTDNTEDILDKLAHNDKKIIVIKSKQGWGNAVRAGINIAEGIVCCFMVSDGQIDASIIPQLYQKYRTNNDPKIVLWKVWRTSRENSARFINSRIYNLISRIIFNISSKDVNATPKLIETELLKSISLTADNIAIDLELLLEIKKRRLGWIEIPVQSIKREAGESTTKLKTVLEMTKWMVKLLFR